MATGTNGIATVENVTTNHSVTLSNTPTNTKKCPAYEWWDPQNSVFVDNYSGYSAKRLVKYSDIKLASETTCNFYHFNFIEPSTFTSFTVPTQLSLYGNDAVTHNFLCSPVNVGLRLTQTVTSNPKAYVDYLLSKSSTTGLVNGATWTKFYIRLYYGLSNIGYLQSNVITATVGTGNALSFNTSLNGTFDRPLLSGNHFILTSTLLPSGFNFTYPLQINLPASILNKTTSSVYMLYSSSDMTSSITDISTFRSMSNSPSMLGGCISATTSSVYYGNFSSGSVPTISMWKVGHYYLLLNGTLYTFSLSSTDLASIQKGEVSGVTIKSIKTLT